MAFGLVIPGLFNKVLRLAREGSNCLADKFVIFLNGLSVLFFLKKVMEFYKIVMVKVGRSSFINVVYMSGAHGLSRVIKCLIIGKILNLLLTAGIAELYIRNVFLGKWANTFSASDKDKGKGKDNKNVNAAKGDKAAAVNIIMALTKGIEIIPLE